MVPGLMPLMAAAAEGGEAAAAEGAAGLVRSLPFHGLMAVVALAFLATLVASKFATKLRVPAILGVLLLGAAINGDTVVFTAEGVERLHILSLSMLLFYAGLTTNFKQIRKFIGYGLALAVGGVIVSSLIFGGLIYGIYAVLSQWSNNPEILPLPLTVCLLVAACLGSTDAGATLNVLNSVRHLVPERVRNLLEFESSVNDPAAILFLLLVVGITVGTQGAPSILGDGALGGSVGQIQLFIKSIGSGIMVGLILTYIAQWVLRKFISSKDQILIVGISIALASYGLSTTLYGSGFISAYVTGLFLANNIYDNPVITQDLLENSMEPFNTLMEMLVFLLFGVIIDPTNIRLVLPEGILCALALMLVARPLSVLLFRGLSPFSNRENLLISWCGLRGAVPLALGYTVIHTIHAFPQYSAATIRTYSNEVEGLIFLVVLLNLALQGLTLPLLCRRLGLRGEAAEAGAAP
jgi:potassium/hydrogen antiporter